MRIAILIGSNRSRSNSARVGAHFGALLTRRDPRVEVDRIELQHSDLPLWSEAADDSSSDVAGRWAPYAARLCAAEALVIVTPEWNGTVPPALHNFLMYCSTAELAHKPGLLVAVASTVGGAYPIAELRMSAYKNNRLCLIPEHVIVRHVDHALLHPDTPSSPHDAEVRSRLENAADVLLAYTESLTEMRRRFYFDFKRHPYGM